jgi:hypothetical protein
MMKDKFDKWLMGVMHKKISFVDMYRLTRYRIMICLSIIFLAGKNIRAQHTHFIYLQHEQSTAFYVKHEGRIIRSSPQGYLILSKLQKGKQLVYVGLNEANQPLLQFVLENLDKDRGFLIKNFTGSGWGLFDLQTSVIINPVNENTQAGKAEEKKKSVVSVNDPFGNMLADVTKDSAVKYVALPEKPVLKDSVQTKKPDIPKLVEVKKTDSVATKTIPVKRSSVKLLDKQENDSSYQFAFVVSQAKKADTIHVHIDKSAPDAVQPDTVRAENVIIPDTVLFKTDEPAVASDTATLLKKEPVVDTKSIIADEHEVKETIKLVDAASDSIVVKQEAPVAAKNQAINSCKKTASEDDFIRLRKKMAGQRTEEKMMEEAQKVFRQMCFSSLQIGQLSGLFLSDEMKYRFFDAAVRYVSDLQEFPTLGNQIRDPYYRKRFDALMPNP